MDDNYKTDQDVAEAIASELPVVEVDNVDELIHKATLDEVGSEAMLDQELQLDESPVDDDSATGDIAVVDESTNELDESEVENTESLHEPEMPKNPGARWYIVHTYAGHENKVATNLKQRIDSEHLENKIFDILVPTQEKIEIRSGKKETVKEKIFPGYILVNMLLEDISWLAVRTTPGVTSFVGIGNKPTPISDAEVRTIVNFTSEAATPQFKDIFNVDDTVKIAEGPFAEFIGKVESIDKERGKVKVMVSIFGRETPVELDFLQVKKL